MATVDPELSAKRRAAADKSWADTTPAQRRARTEAARTSYLEQLGDEVDPHHALDDDERHQAARRLQRVRLAEATLRSLGAQAHARGTVGYGVVEVVLSDALRRRGKRLIRRRT